MICASPNSCESRAPQGCVDRRLIQGHLVRRRCLTRAPDIGLQRSFAQGLKRAARRSTSAALEERLRIELCLKGQDYAQAAAISAVERVLVRVRVSCGRFLNSYRSITETQLDFKSSRLSIQTRAIIQIGHCCHLAVSNPRSFPNPWPRIWAFDPNRSVSGDSDRRCGWSRKIGFVLAK